VFTGDIEGYTEYRHSTAKSFRLVANSASLRRRKHCPAGATTAHAPNAWERRAASASLTKDG